MMTSIETIYALGLDELVLGRDDGKPVEVTPEDREILAAIGAEAVGENSDINGSFGVFALLASLFRT